MARRAIRQDGYEEALVANLAEQAVKLIDSIEVPEAMPVSPETESKLAMLSSLVVKARSVVVRDSFTREITSTCDTEAPPRLAKQLLNQLNALRIIGCDEARAWRIARKTGLDSMPRFRHDLLLQLAEHPSGTTPKAIHERQPISLRSVHRVLEELAIFGIAERTETSHGPHGALWHLTEEAQARWDAIHADEEVPSVPETREVIAVH
jgi:hypothetical protein